MPPCTGGRLRAAQEPGQRTRDRAIRETRRTELLVAPGLQYIATEQLLFSVSVQVPAFTDVEGDGLERDYGVLAEFRFAF